MGRRTRDEEARQALERLQQVVTHNLLTAAMQSHIFGRLGSGLGHALPTQLHHTGDCFWRTMQAKACKQSHKLQDQPHITASCALLGNRYGVGIGLYFQIIAWLRWMLLWLAICMVS